jgi:hypothetical protein
MRTTIISIILLFVYSAVRTLALPTNGDAITNKSYPRLDTFMREMISRWFKGAETNGMSCAVTFLGAGPECPVCYVSLINDTTNNVYGVFRPSPGMLFDVELFDSKSNSMAKTEVGKTYGQPLTQQQLNDWFEKHMDRHGEELQRVPPSMVISPFSEFSISEVFLLQKPGEYTLHLRMRLMQHQQDASGHFYFSVMWLPAVVADFHLRPEDIPPTNLPLNHQTNSLAK